MSTKCPYCLSEPSCSKIPTCHELLQQVSRSTKAARIEGRKRLEALEKEKKNPHEKFFRLAREWYDQQHKLNMFADVRSIVVMAVAEYLANQEGNSIYKHHPNFHEIVPELQGREAGSYG